MRDKNCTRGTHLDFIWTELAWYKSHKSHKSHIITYKFKFVQTVFSGSLFNWSDERGAQVMNGSIPERGLFNQASVKFMWF